MSSEELNYNHFYYFWRAVREGGIQTAARAMGLTHPTLSVQIRQLEERVGVQLLDRKARRIRLTERGRVAYQYAEEIFSLGREFLDVMHGHGEPGRTPVVVGITDAMPKLIVRRLLQPALDLDSPVRLICQHDRHDRLLAELALHKVDVVLADAPCPSSSGIRAFNHHLGRSGLSFFATDTIKQRLSGPFPALLTGQPMLAPTATTSLGRALIQWLHEHDLHPHIVAEFEDSALMKTFGQEGAGIFATPTVMEDEVCRQYQTEVIGRTEELEESFFAISMERRLQNPAVAAICREAREHLFV